MSYCIYQTEGFILNKRDVGEADRIYSFFTKDFGRLAAKSQGVRYLKSKLRYSLSGFSFLKMAFVATSAGCWRLVDVEETRIFDGIKKSGDKTKCALKIFSLLERLIQGQEKDLELWEKLKQALIFLERNDLNKNDLKNFEMSVALQIVAHLGYAEKGGAYSDPVSVIRHALEASQL
jgi:DNA repair protein RecO (recombination protein O)